MKRLNLKICFTAAWKSFAKWWLLLCLVAAPPCIYTIFLGGSNFMKDWREAKTEVAPIMERYQENQDLAALSQDLQAWLDARKAKATNKTNERNWIWIFSSVFIITVFLQIALILCSKRATEKDAWRGNADLKRGFQRSFLLSFSYLIMALVKFLPFLFLLPLLLIFIILGIFIPYFGLVGLLVYALGWLYFYARWYFSDYIVTEESANPFLALRKSWNVCNGNMFPVFVIVLTSFILHLPALVTFGLSTIPTRSFDFTLRATAYRQLTGKDDA